MRSVWLDTYEVPSTATDRFVPGAHYDPVGAGPRLTGLTTALLRAAPDAIAAAARRVMARCD